MNDWNEDSREGSLTKADKRSDEPFETIDENPPVFA